MYLTGVFSFREVHAGSSDVDSAQSLLSARLTVHARVWAAHWKHLKTDGAYGFKKEANAERPQTCMLSFLQQGQPKYACKKD